MYNKFDPKLRFSEKIVDYGISNGIINLDMSDNFSTPLEEALFSYTKSEKGVEKISDSISKLKTIRFKLPRDLPKEENVWKSD